jgi:hypothetical protein
MPQITFECASNDCNATTREVAKKSWRLRPSGGLLLKDETKETSYICYDCYQRDLEARKQAESRPATRSSAESSNPVREKRPRSELDHLAALSGGDTAAPGPRRLRKESSELSLENLGPPKDQSLMPMEFMEEDLTSSPAGGQVELPLEVGTSEEANDEELPSSMEENIRLFEAEYGLVKEKGEQGAAFLRRVPAAGPTALNLIRELLRKLYILEKETKHVREAGEALRKAERPPFLSCERFSLYTMKRRFD